MEVMLPVAGVQVNILYLVLLGFGIGYLAGMLGVGGGSLLTPMLNILFGIPYNVAVGSDLAQLVGSSTSATIRHSSFGHIDYRLGLLMVAGSASGIEVGAQLLTLVLDLRKISLFGVEIPLLDLLLNGLYTVLLAWIAFVVLRESLRARRRASERGDDEYEDDVPLSGLGEKMLALEWGPMISLPTSGIPRISIWIILGIGFITGVLSGFLGIGGGFIRLPAMIYLIGCPTLVAVGTDLFEIMISSAFGAFTHGWKGNVDLVLVVGLILGSSFGSALGATTSRFVKPATLRTTFAVVTVVGCVIVFWKLLSLFA